MLRYAMFTRSAVLHRATAAVADTSRPTRKLQPVASATLNPRVLSTTNSRKSPSNVASGTLLKRANIKGPMMHSAGSKASRVSKYVSSPEKKVWKAAGAEKKKFSAKVSTKSSLASKNHLPVSCGKLAGRTYASTKKLKKKQKMSPKQLGEEREKERIRLAVVSALHQQAASVAKAAPPSSPPSPSAPQPSASSPPSESSGVSETFQLYKLTPQEEDELKARNAMRRLMEHHHHAQKYKHEMDRLLRERALVDVSGLNTPQSGYFKHMTLPTGTRSSCAKRPKGAAPSDTVTCEENDGFLDFEENPSLLPSAPASKALKSTGLFSPGGVAQPQVMDRLSHVKVAPMETIPPSELRDDLMTAVMEEEAEQSVSADEKSPQKATASETTPIA